MSEKRKINFCEFPGEYGEIASVTFSEEPMEPLEAYKDDIREGGTSKSYRLAEIEGELYVLVMESVSELTTHQDGTPIDLTKFDGDFDKKINVPNDAFMCRAQRNRIANAVKINKDGLLERPSQEIMDDLLSRKGSYTFECGTYREDDYNHDDPYDFFCSDSDIGDDLFEDQLVPATALGIEIDESLDGLVVSVGDYPVTIRENGIIEDELGNRFEDGQYEMVSSELAREALEARRVESKFAHVIAAAKTTRKRRDDKLLSDDKLRKNGRSW